MRTTRRNISITNEAVDLALDRSENASKFVEKAILYYLEEHEKHYATIEDLEETNRRVEILKEALNKIVEAIMAGGKE